MSFLYKKINYCSAIKISLISVVLIILLIHCVEGYNKYSEQANKPKQKQKPKTEFSLPTNIKELRELDKPFRMHKLNLLWTKAKHRLTDPKLQSLFSDLKIHDKEEIAFKHAKSDGKDEIGLEEARMRKKLIGIMSRYDLLEHFEKVDHDTYIKPKLKKQDYGNYVIQDVFKDKRLNHLWAKAERAGFNHEELEALKEEFTHHQEKVNEYLSLLSEVEAGDQSKHENSVHEDHESWNELESQEESNDVSRKNDKYLAKANLLKEKHLEVRTGYDHLENIAAKGPKSKEFIDPKVQELWNMALEAKFSTNELLSLREELLHYEKRLLKLRHLHTEAALEAARRGKEYKPNTTHETYIKKHALDVDKLHKDLEAKILQKHTEL
ncbi:alpha-2-macroglobulin receptor-associated protein [Phymastichus coffea]|uniref:alpha-2-macroglobulin receptor-associated protein n=1 Tax=Phymastichus coffea TaxID=108790 RepID=UPI00273CADBE|nr:alpha-2-macroglobulin receptor-associated protein [Phymastichus coffea]